MGDGVRVAAPPVLMAVLPLLAAACEGDIFPPDALLRAGSTFTNPGREEIERCGGTNAAHLSAPLPGNSWVPLFDRVFDGRYPVINHFDHDQPHPFVDDNGFQVDWCGRLRTGQIDGHSGYDFVMPEGVPIRAAADGEVTFAGTDGPFHCPFEGEVRDQVKVDIVHLLPDGRRVVSTYKHLSYLVVTAKQPVLRGQIIALSGNTGCSTLPHLHFETWLLAGPAGTPVAIDPFGWQGQGADPWAEKPGGAASIWLWRAGQAPDLSVKLAPAGR